MEGDRRRKWAKTGEKSRIGGGKGGMVGELSLGYH